MPKSTKKQKNNNTEIPNTDPLNIEAVYGIDFRTYYSNYASVSHSPEDLSIDFCQVTQPYKIDMEKKTLQAPVTAKVIIPPRMAQGLIRALSAQLENFQKELEQLEGKKKE